MGAARKIDTDAPPPVAPRWRDDVVAEELGVTVVWLRREILDKVKGTCLKTGRSRYLTERHIKKVEAIMEAMASEKAEERECRSTSTAARPASGTSVGRSKASGWIKALELAQRK
jgi:hypothetical protein